MCVACGDGLPAPDAAGPDAASPDAGVDSGLPFRETYDFEGEFPEGGIYDEAGHRFFVGSLADGAVREIDAASGAERVLFEETAGGTWWTLGMDVDARTNRLFVCAMDDRRGSDEAVPYDGYVWVFDLATGERIANHDLGTLRDDATCTDVVVAEDGSAYVCDRENPRIYRIAPSGELSLLAEDPLLGAGIGQNALVVLPDQSALLSLLYLSAKLVHVDLVDGAVREVEIDGGFIDRSPALSGADGMAWDDGSVLVAFTSQVTRVTPSSADWTRANAVSVDVDPGMTDVVVTPAGAYLLNGQAVTFALGGDPEPSRLVLFEGEM